MEISSGNIENISRAARVINGGGIVAFPTETVYGLGADALNPLAVSRIFEAKGRPYFDPLIVHIADISWLERLSFEVPPQAMVLARRMKGLSVVGVSVLGAVAHNTAQMLVACFIVGTRAILAYLPVLLLAAAVTGTLTGLVARYTFRGLGPRSADAAPDVKNSAEKQRES